MTISVRRAEERLRPVKGRAVALGGAYLVAEAMRQINPDVVAAYPITPQTLIVERFSEFVANGEVGTELVTVESEHSAMSACIGAAAAGARVQTATTSQGLAYMWETLPIASAFRLPIVMHFVSRALSAPINIHCDHSDFMGARDSGWVMLFAENGQEAYDNAIQAIRIAEHPEVLLPVLHSQDGFTVSHSVERAEVLPDEVVREFIGEWQPRQPLLDVRHPVTYGSLALPDSYFEIKYQVAEAMERALAVVAAVSEEYGELSGRRYGWLDPYLLDDADYVIVIMGSAAGTARAAVEELRGRGVKVGLLRVRCFRPFPAAAVAQALEGKRAVAVLDRALSPGGAAHALFMEVATALVTHGVSPKLVNYVYGLGGRDVVPAQFGQVVAELQEIDKTGSAQPTVRYLGLGR